MKNTPIDFILKSFFAPVFVCLLAASYVTLSPTACLAQTAASPAVSSAAGPANLALVPMPYEVKERGVLSLDRGIDISTTSSNADDRFTVTDLVDTLKNRGVKARGGTGGKVKIVLLRLDTKKAADILAHAHVSFDAAMHDQGYVLLTDGSTTYDIAATSIGLYYGTQTIKQLVVVNRTGHAASAVLHGVLIRDWPAMKYRGVSDDLSRGPFPTLKFQEHQVRVFSEYKMNIYSPYFENTLAYASNPLTAPPGGAMTRNDVEQLVRYAKRYHVTIVPEQESFAHLHQVLKFEMYSKLAEMPESDLLSPVQPGSLQLIRQWFTEVTSMFPGPFIHIGGDETSDLGRGQSKALVAGEGQGKAYVDFMTKIYSALQPLHKRILFWGDIARKHPELVKDLPKDMIAVPWGYGPNVDAERLLRPFVDAGMETWVSPGVDSLRNIQRFVSVGQRMGSTGELNTIWHDGGQGLDNQDWYGILFGAAAGWQSGASSIPRFQNSFGQVFHGDLTGKINQAQMDLKAARKMRRSAGVAFTTDQLFWADPWNQEGQAMSAKLLPVVHAMRMKAEKSIVLIDQARAAAPLRESDALDALEMSARRIDILGYKFKAAHRINEEYHHAYSAQNDPKRADDLRNDLWSAAGQSYDLRDDYGLARDLYRQAWLRENRPFWLDNLMAHYELEMQRWIQRGASFDRIHDQWDKTGKLPKPEDIGLPPIPSVPPEKDGNAGNPAH